MAFRYENYGTADLLSISGTTIITDTTKYGIAFYQPQQVKCFNIPSCQEIWLKCDILTTSTYDPDKKQLLRIYNLGTAGACGFSTAISSSHTQGLLQTFYNGNYQSKGTNRNRSFVKNCSYSLLLHMHADISDGTIEWKLNDGRTDIYTGDVNGGADFDNIFIQCDSDTVLISNVIISDEEIGLNENATMPFSASVDTLRELVDFFPFSIAADTSRNLSNNFSVNNDTSRQITEFFSLLNDTQRQLVNITPFSISNDTARILAENFSLINDTQRDIQKSFTLSCDTIKRRPHTILLDAIF